MRLKDLDDSNSEEYQYDETDELINRKKPNLIMLYVLLLIAVITFTGYRWQYAHNEKMWTEQMRELQQITQCKISARKDSLQLEQTMKIINWEIENTWLFGEPQIVIYQSYAGNDSATAYSYGACDTMYVESNIIYSNGR
jgi:hypothetical protein